MRSVGAGDHGLSGRAAGVDAGAAEEFAFDEGDGLAGGGETGGERGASLAGSDDDGVKGLHAGLDALLGSVEGPPPHTFR